MIPTLTATLGVKGHRPGVGTRERATPNRLFDTTADLRRSLRSSPSYLQTVRRRVLTPVNRPAKKPTASAGLRMRYVSGRSSSKHRRSTRALPELRSHKYPR